MGIYTVFNLKLKPNEEMINFGDDLLSRNGVYNNTTANYRYSLTCKLHHISKRVRG